MVLLPFHLAFPPSNDNSWPPHAPTWCCASFRPHILPFAPFPSSGTLDEAACSDSICFLPPAPHVLSLFILNSRCPVAILRPWLPVCWCWLPLQLHYRSGTMLLPGSWLLQTGWVPVLRAMVGGFHNTRTPVFFLGFGKTFISRPTLVCQSDNLGSHVFFFCCPSPPGGWRPPGVWCR